MKKKKAPNLIQEGDKLLNKQDLDGAEQKYREALIADPSSIDALYSLGAVATHRNEFGIALDWADQALTIDNNDKKALGLKANALMGLGRWEDAIPFLQSASGAEGDRLYRAQIGFCFEALERWNEAEDQLRSVLETDPTYISRYNVIAMYDHSPFEADLHHALARVLQHQGKVDDARLHYHLAKRVDPLIELDPMYLEIMKTEDLEDHPVDTYAEPQTTGDPLGDRVQELLAISDCNILKEKCREQNDEEFVSFIVSGIKALQIEGKYYLSARLRAIGDLVYGEDNEPLCEVLQLTVWEKLFETAELLHKKVLTPKEADGFLDGIDFPWDTSKPLYQLTRRFIEIDAESSMWLVYMVERLLSRSPEAEFAGLGHLLMGKTYSRLLQLDKAIASYTLASQAFERAGSSRLLESLMEIGMLHGRQENYAAGLEVLDRIIKQAGEEEPKYRVYGLFNRALMLLNSHHAAESYSTGLEATEAIKRWGADYGLRSDLLTILNQAAQQLKYEIPKDVLEVLQSKVAITEIDRSLDGILAAADQAQTEGNWESALKLLKEALDQDEGINRKLRLKITQSIGNILIELDRLEEATEYLKEALTLGQELGGEVNLWQNFIDLAYLSEEQDENEVAVEYLEKALVEARRHKSREQEKHTLQYLSNLLIKKDPDRAVEYFGLSLELEEGNTENLPITWTQGTAAMDSGDYQTGIKFLSQLLKDKSMDAEKLYPQALANIGIAYANLGKVDRTVENWQEAVDIWENRGRYDNAIELCSRLIILQYDNRMNYKDNLEKTLRIWSDISSPGIQASAGTELGRSLQHISETTRAEEVLKKVISIATSTEWRSSQNELQARKTLGILYRQLGRYEEAIIQYNGALEQARFLKSEAEEGEIYGWLAIAFRFLDRMDEAIASYQNAIHITERYGDTGQAAVHRMNLASSLFLIGRHDEAKETALKASVAFDAVGRQEYAERTLLMLTEYIPLAELPIEISSRIDNILERERNSDDPFLIRQIRTLEAQRLAEAGDFPSAKRIMSELIRRFQKLNDPYNEAWCLLRRAQALRSYEPSQALADAKWAKEIATDFNKHDLLVKGSELLLDLALQTGDLEKAQHELSFLRREWIHARNRLPLDADRLNYSNNIATLIDGWLATAIHKGYNRLSFELQELGRSQALIDLILESLESPVSSRKLSENNTFESDPRKITTDEHGLLDEPKTRDEFNFAKILNLLKELEHPTTIITFGLIGDEVLTMVFRRDWHEPKIYSTGIDGKMLNSILSTFDREIHLFRGYGSESWRNQAAALFRGIENDVQLNDLVILLPQDGLDQLPLHAVCLPTGEMLLERAAVLYAPSLQVMYTLRPSKINQKKKESRLMTVGVAFPDEARAISLRFGGPCLSGRSVDKNNIRDQISRNSILHFACHGSFDPKNYLDSGLVLRIIDKPLRKDILSVRDLMNWRLNSDLVTLSACETGRGIETPSEFLGLARGFLAAGARSVIVALWSIDDLATRDFMVALYANLEEKYQAHQTVSLVDALRRTQLSFAQHYRLYDWSAFKLIGWPVIPKERLVNYGV